MTDHSIDPACVRKATWGHAASVRSLAGALALVAALESPVAQARDTRTDWAYPLAGSIPAPLVDLGAVRERTRKYEGERQTRSLSQAAPLFAADTKVIVRAEAVIGGRPSWWSRLGFPREPTEAELRMLQGTGEQMRQLSSSLSEDSERAERYLHRAAEAASAPAARALLARREAVLTRTLASRRDEADALLARIVTGIELRTGGAWSRIVLYARQLTGRDPATALADLKDRLSRWGSSDPAVLSSDLTYVHGALQPGPFPRLSVVPAYAAQSSGLELEDTTQGREVEQSPEIVVKAQELGTTKGAFDFVRSSIRLAWYYGGMQGATQTLRSLRGNDADAAALLISLLRAQGTPARYVRGTIELSIGRLAALMGVADAVDPGSDVGPLVLRVLAAAGVPHEPVVSGGRVSAARVLHTWIEAFVPYGDYRGVGHGAAAKQWIPLDPVIPGTDQRQTTGCAVDAWGDSGASAEALVQTYLGGSGGMAPLDLVREAMTTHLAASHPGLSYDSVRCRSRPSEEPLPFIPGTLPYDVVSVAGEYAFLPDETNHRAHIVVSDRAGPILDVTTPLHELVGRRTVLTYVPATDADYEIVSAAGDLYRAPAGLVQVVPELRVDGRPVGTGTRAIGLGEVHDWRIELLLPDGTRRIVENRGIAGNVVAIGFGSPGNAYVERPPADGTDVDGPAPRFLYGRAARYASEWTDAEEELAAVLRVLPVRPTASLVLVENQLAVDQALGIPRRVLWKGLEVDADLRSVTPVDLVPGRGREFLRISGYQGSFLEAKVLEEGSGEEAISAVRVLQTASARGIPVVVLNRDNLDSLSGSIDAPADVLADARDLVARGREVRIPVTPISVRNWIGTGYVARDPSTEEGGYFLSGRVSGGQTVVSPEYWTDPALVATLDAPTARPSTPDLRRIYRIVKVETGDQEAVVGRPFPKPLVVYVSTREGFPVSGAPVEFFSTEPNAEPKFLIPGAAEPLSSVTVLTDSRGRASVQAFPDVSVWRWAILRHVGPADQLVGVNAMSARTLGPQAKTVTLADPFVGIGIPDGASRIVLLDQTSWAAPARMILGQDLLATVQDRYGNPIANEAVTWSQIPATGAFIDPANRPASHVVLLDATDPAQVIAPAPMLTDTLGRVVTSFINGGAVHRVTASAGNGLIEASYTVSGVDYPDLRYVFGWVPEQRTSGLDGVYADWPGAPTRVSYPEPFVFQLLRRGGAGEPPWVAIRGDEPEYAAVSLEMTTSGGGIAPSVDAVQPRDVLFAPIDTEHNAVFWPMYRVPDGLQTLTVHANVTLASNGARDCCQSSWEFAHRSSSVRVTPLRIALGDQWLAPDGGSARIGDVAIAFQVENPASFPLYARIVESPTRPGDHLVSMPTPTEVARHPADPLLLRIAERATGTLVLGVVGGSRGGSVRIDVFSPDAIRGPNALTLDPVASSSIRIPDLPRFELRPDKTTFVVEKAFTPNSGHVADYNVPAAPTGEVVTVSALMDPPATTPIQWSAAAQGTPEQWTDDCAYCHAPGTVRRPTWRGVVLQTTGNTARVRFDPDFHRSYRAKPLDSPIQNGHGSKLPAPPFVLVVTATVDGVTRSIEIKQDEIDRIRQEYIGHGLGSTAIGVPDRSVFVPARASAYWGNSLMPKSGPPAGAVPYGVVPGNPEPLADAVLASFRDLSSDPSADLMVTSAWRNPERNEAVGGVYNSLHQSGNAVDIRPVTVPAADPGRSLTWCTLEAAAQAVVIPGYVTRAFTEHNSMIVPCTNPTVTHVHVQIRN